MDSSRFQSEIGSYTIATSGENSANSSCKKSEKERETGEFRERYCAEQRRSVKLVNHFQSNISSTPVFCICFNSHLLPVANKKKESPSIRLTRGEREVTAVPGAEAHHRAIRCLFHLFSTKCNSTSSSHPVLFPAFIDILFWPSSKVKNRLPTPCEPDPELNGVRIMRET
jgi:hypothetical protein